MKMQNIIVAWSQRSIHEGSTSWGTTMISLTLRRSKKLKICLISTDRAPRQIFQNFF